MIMDEIKLKNASSNQASSHIGAKEKFYKSSYRMKLCLTLLIAPPYINICLKRYLITLSFMVEIWKPHNDASKFFSYIKVKRMCF